MRCPKCDFEQADGSMECARCGIIFEKIQRREEGISKTETVPEEEELRFLESGNFFQRFFLSVEPGINPLFFGGRVLVFLILLVWGWKFILSPMEGNYTASSFFHLVNLPFHEAGHILFRPLGRFMTSLGGSLFQLLMPLICLAVLLIKTRDTFGAAACLWWFGQNFMDLAPYINDARSLSLPLLGGNIGRNAPYGFHDWEFILKESGLLRYDHALANGSYGIGIVIMSVSFVWAGYLLFRQYINLDVRK